MKECGDVWSGDFGYEDGRRCVYGVCGVARVYRWRCEEVRPVFIGGEVFTECVERPGFIGGGVRK